MLQIGFANTMHYVSVNAALHIQAVHLYICIACHCIDRLNVAGFRPMFDAQVPCAGAVRAGGGVHCPAIIQANLD